jgi:hypothetical protein
MGRFFVCSNRGALVTAAILLSVSFDIRTASAQPTIQRPTAAAGGGATLGGSFLVTGTIGQAITGTASGGVYQARLGFWPGGSAGPVAVADPPPTVSWSFRLDPATPNPLSTSTRIAFEIPAQAPVSLSIFDAGGRLVRVLVRETLEPGPHRVEWDGTGADRRPVPSGIYFSILTTPTTRATRLMAVLR